jgi:hypothetical protein
MSARLPDTLCDKAARMLARKTGVNFQVFGCYAHKRLDAPKRLGGAHEIFTKINQLCQLNGVEHSPRCEHS